MRRRGFLVLLTEILSWTTCEVLLRKWSPFINVTHNELKSDRLIPERLRHEKAVFFGANQNFYSM
jgi:hypothetical protein